MKKSILYITFTFLSSVVFGQGLKNNDSTLRKIDSISIRIDSIATRIDENVGKLKDELLKAPAAFTGQSIFEDRNGNSAIFLPSGGTLRLNTADASIKLSFAKRVSTKKAFYGFDISGKTIDGLQALFSKGNVSPGAKVNGIIGLQELFHSSEILDGWLALKAGYEASSFKLFNPDSVFANQIQKTSLSTFTSSVNYNMSFINSKGIKLLALSVGYQQVNNYDDLNELELTDTKFFKDSLSNTIRTYENKVNVRTGDFKTYDQIAINLDFYWTPNKSPRIGFYHYWRTKVRNGKLTNGVGSGMYLLKKKNPLTSIAGIVLEVSDISKLNDGFGKNFSINFVAAYNFGFTNSNLH